MVHEKLFITCLKATLYFPKTSSELDLKKSYKNGSNDFDTIGGVTILLQPKSC